MALGGTVPRVLLEVAQMAVGTVVLAQDLDCRTSFDGPKAEALPGLQAR
jgi:hypothetical protein